jgi:hypothetical protein
MMSNNHGSMADVAKFLRRGKNPHPHVILGPIVWELKGDRKRWYFITVTGDAKGARLDQFTAQDKTLCEAVRANLQIALFQLQSPLVVHDMDDELALARLSENLWPSPKTTKLRTDIEAERRTIACPQS